MHASTNQSYFSIDQEYLTLTRFSAAGLVESLARSATTGVSWMRYLVFGWLTNEMLPNVVL